MNQLSIRQNAWFDRDRLVLLPEKSWNECLYLAREVIYLTSFCQKSLPCFFFFFFSFFFFFFKKKLWPGDVRVARCDADLDVDQYFWSGNNAVDNRPFLKDAFICIAFCRTTFPGMIFFRRKGGLVG